MCFFRRLDIFRIWREQHNGLFVIDSSLLRSIQNISNRTLEAILFQMNLKTQFVEKNAIRSVSKKKRKKDKINHNQKFTANLFFQSRLISFLFFYPQKIIIPLLSSWKSGSFWFSSLLKIFSSATKFSIVAFLDDFL